MKLIVSYFYYIRYTTKLIAIPAITGIGILSSMGLYASVIAPHKAPTSAGISGSWVNAPISATIKNAEVPTKVFLSLKGNGFFPNFFPNMVDAESPSKKISIAALSMAMLNLNN